jgi:hypothetical protein
MGLLYDLVSSAIERLFPRPRLVAECFDAVFPEADCAYNSLSRAGDGGLIYALSSHRADRDARLFRFDPQHGVITNLPEIAAATHAGPTKAIADGKVHVRPVEHQGKLVFATHIGYYDEAEGWPKPGRLDGFERYQGGCILSLDPDLGRYRVLGRAPVDEGIIATAVDTDRHKMFGLTWPSGLLLRCDLVKGSVVDLGPVLGRGETLNPADDEYQPVCRCPGIDPGDGTLYWTNRQGVIHRLRSDCDTPESLISCDLRSLAPDRATEPRSWGHTWRNLVWRPEERAFYGMLGTAPAVLFRFDPAREMVTKVCDIGGTPRIREPDLRVPWVTLALQLAPDGDTLHYIGMDRGPMGRDTRRLTVARPITYHIPSGSYMAHGRLELGDGRIVTQCESIEVTDGFVYGVGTTEWPRRTHSATKPGEPGHTHGPVDLIRYRDPS